MWHETSSRSVPTAGLPCHGHWQLEQQADKLTHDRKSILWVLQIRSFHESCLISWVAWNLYKIAIKKAFCGIKRADCGFSYCEDE